MELKLYKTLRQGYALSHRYRSECAHCNTVWQYLYFNGRDPDTDRFVLPEMHKVMVGQADATGAVDETQMVEVKHKLFSRHTATALIQKLQATHQCQKEATNDN